jgi:hypothetical protein
MILMNTVPVTPAMNTEANIRYEASASVPFYAYESPLYKVGRPTLQIS